MTDTLTATLEYQGRHQDPDGWDHNLYKATLHYQGRRMTTQFRTGIGWTTDPTAADIIESLLSDAAGIDDDRGFDEWAEELGYDPDSRKAERIYKLIESQTKRLERLLGDDYQAALYPVDEDPEQVAARLTGATVQT